MLRTLRSGKRLHKLSTALLPQKTHQRGVRARRQLCGPELFACVFVEGTKTAVVGGTDEPQAAAVAREPPIFGAPDGGRPSRSSSLLAQLVAGGAGDRCV